MLYPLTINRNDIYLQRKWSDETFGPGKRTKGVIAHIRKELEEVEADPTDVSEWADLLILAIDGATRQGIPGSALIEEYHRKMSENMAREWPDWRLFSEDEPIEHIRVQPNGQAEVHPAPEED